MANELGTNSMSTLELAALGDAINLAELSEARSMSRTLELLAIEHSRRLEIQNSNSRALPFRYRRVDNTASNLHQEKN